MTAFYGEELFEMYMLQHPGDQRHVRMVDLPDEDEPQIACRYDVMVRWMDWMLQRGHITREKHDEALSMMEGAIRHAEAQSKK